MRACMYVSIFVSMNLYVWLQKPSRIFCVSQVDFAPSHYFEPVLEFLRHHNLGLLERWYPILWALLLRCACCFGPAFRNKLSSWRCGMTTGPGLEDLVKKNWLWHADPVRGASQRVKFATRLIERKQTMSLSRVPTRRDYPSWRRQGVEILSTNVIVPC